MDNNERKKNEDYEDYKFLAFDPNNNDSFQVPIFQGYFHASRKVYIDKKIEIQVIVDAGKVRVYIQAASRQMRPQWKTVDTKEFGSGVNTDMRYPTSKIELDESVKFRLIIEGIDDDNSYEIRGDIPVISKSSINQGEFHEII